MGEITVGSNSRHATVRVSFQKGATPLDMDLLERELSTASILARWNLRRAAFVHNVDLLRAALYAQATSTSLAESFSAMALYGDARIMADRLLTSTLNMAGWHQDTPEPNPRPRFKDSMFGDLRLPVNIGQERHGDVLVNLHSGLTIVADADGAERYHWEHLWRETPVPVRGEPWEWATVDPDDIAVSPADQWWWTQNYTDGASQYDHGEERRQRRENLSVPDLPVDLAGILKNL